jgi:DNA-entry nuclease
MKKKQKKKLVKLLFYVVIMLFLSAAGYFGGSYEEVYNKQGTQQPSYQSTTFDLENIPEFQENKPYVIINNNKPRFEEKYFTTQPFEKYSDLDSLGRCGIAFANIGIDIMPTEKRESISNIKPTGWHTVKYDCVEGKYLYNRCHLIGYQLTAENANEKNLITGTRFMNIQGMLPFENEVAEYIKRTKNHVLYRVTPIFKGNNLLASGVQLEAKSVEDKGKGICFNVYIYNNQPNIKIDYETGKSEYVK